MSRSWAEAEYRFMAALTSELKWLHSVLSDLGVSSLYPMLMYCDSQSALHIAQIRVSHKSTKHIEVDCHYVRDAIKDGLISPTHVSTTEQCADI